MHPRAGTRGTPDISEARDRGWPAAAIAHGPISCGPAGLNRGVGDMPCAVVLVASYLMDEDNLGSIPTPGMPQASDDPWRHQRERRRRLADTLRR